MHRIIDAVRRAGSSRGWSWAAAVSVVLLVAALVPATAAAATQTLTVKKEGTGTGTVTSSPVGISCGETCSAPFSEGSQVVLKAVSGPNTAEVGWSGCTPNLEGECKVTIGSKPITVTATFNLLERPLTVDKKGAGTGTVTSSPAGIECGATCKANFVKESTVVLTGSPGAKTLPPTWSGCNSVDGENKCHVTMSIAKTVTATFDLSEYGLTVKKAGTGTGTVTSSPAGIECGATCAASFKTASLVTLTGSPGANTAAVQWSGCDSVDGEGKCLATISAAREVTATFNLVQRQLKVVEAGTGTGTVTSSPGGISCGATCQASYAHGTTVTLTGAAGLHSEGVKWLGCEAIVEIDKCKVTMSAAMEVSAVFSLEPQYVQYMVTVGLKGTGKGSVSSTPAGIACPTDCSSEFTSKTVLKLVATPAPGSELARWSLKTCGTSTTCTITVRSARQVNAVFTAVGTRTLTVGKAGSGSGVVTSKPAAIECGQVCSAELDASTKVVLRAIPAVGSTFTGWSGEGCSGTGSCKVSMNEARNVTATFAASGGQLPGILSVRSPIRVKGHKALLRVSCHGGRCAGVVRLTARVRRSSGRTRNVPIGKASVNLEAGVSSTLGMRLSRTGISLLRELGRIDARVSGGGTLPHRVRLSLQRR